MFIGKLRRRLKIGLKFVVTSREARVDMQLMDGSLTCDSNCIVSYCQFMNTSRCTLLLLHVFIWHRDSDWYRHKCKFNWLLEIKHCNHCACKRRLFWYRWLRIYVVCRYSDFPGPINCNKPGPCAINGLCGALSISCVNVDLSLMWEPLTIF